MPARPVPRRARCAPRCAGPTAVDADAPQHVRDPGTTAPSSSRPRTPTRRASTAYPYSRSVRSPPRQWQVRLPAGRAGRT
eukprot:7609873-Heterocapsa_arctica.AAC.1